MKRSRRQALLKEYGEVGQMFRKLTDIRFRLLGLLPLVTGLSVALAVLKGEFANIGVLCFGLFGLAVTAGLVIYNARNDQLYNELVGRAAAIERSLGLNEGHFANRPQAWLVIRLFARNWRIEHGMALKLIYNSVSVLWLSLVFASVLELGRIGYLKRFPPLGTAADPTAWVIAIAVALAFLVIFLVSREINSQLAKRRRMLRRLAAAAYQAALSLENAAPPWQDRQFIRVVRRCARLNGDARKTCTRARFYTQLDAQSLQYYRPVGSDKERAAHLVALLTDLPPRWIFECGQGKHGKVVAPARL